MVLRKKSARRHRRHPAFIVTILRLPSTTAVRAGGSAENKKGKMADEDKVGNDSRPCQA
jgi:hypothetical protein